MKMQFKSESVVTALYPSQGELDNGTCYDSTKAHIETELSSTKEGFGKPSVQYNWGTSQNYRDFISRYPHIKDKFDAVITWENQTTGKNATLAVIDIQPKQAKPQ